MNRKCGDSRVFVRDAESQNTPSGLASREVLGIPEVFNLVDQVILGVRIMELVLCTVRAYCCYCVN